MITKYAKMLPLDPSRLLLHTEAFGLENYERVVVWSPAKQQFFVWGSPVYGKMNKEQRQYLLGRSPKVLQQVCRDGETLQCLRREGEEVQLY